MAKWEKKWWEGIPPTPDGYDWELMGTEQHPGLMLRAKGGLSLGYFNKLHDSEQDKDIWRHSRGFRVSHFDTLEEGMRVMIAKHRLGGLDENERIVF